MTVILRFEKLCWIKWCSVRQTDAITLLFCWDENIRANEYIVSASTQNNRGGLYDLGKQASGDDAEGEEG